jgi:Putative prokaryotic signal transducing protein
VDPDDTAVVKVVSGETEADIVCGLLRSAGIECDYRDTEAIDGPFEGLTESGPREVFVLKSDLEAARSVVANAES